MSLFPDLDDEKAPQAARLAPRLGALAGEGISQHRPRLQRRVPRVVLNP